MVRDRTELSVVLNALAPNVYFQPPINVALKYPCIIYSRDSENLKFADNEKYQQKLKYQLTLIQNDPDIAGIWIAISALPYCSFERHFSADNLNHDVFNLYF